jgi:hypothetical protein
VHATSNLNSDVGSITLKFNRLHCNYFSFFMIKLRRYFENFALQSIWKQMKVLFKVNRFWAFSDGSICYYLSRRKRVSAKGLKVSKEAKWILVV